MKWWQVRKIEDGRREDENYLSQSPQRRRELKAIIGQLIIKPQTHPDKNIFFAWPIPWNFEKQSQSNFHWRRLIKTNLRYREKTIWIF
jgi:hypothetical protein